MEKLEPMVGGSGLSSARPGFSTLLRSLADVQLSYPLDQTATLKQPFQVDCEGALLLEPWRPCAVLQSRAQGQADRHHCNCARIPRCCATGRRVGVKEVGGERRARGCVFGQLTEAEAGRSSESTIESKPRGKVALPRAFLGQTAARFAKAISSLLAKLLQR